MAMSVCLSVRQWSETRPRSAATAAPTGMSQMFLPREKPHPSGIFAGGGGLPVAL